MMTILPRTLASEVAPRTAAAAPETLQHNIGTRAPVRSSTHATWSVAGGSSVANPSCLSARAALG